RLVERHTQPYVEDVLPPAREPRQPRPGDVAHAAPEVVDDRGERDVPPEPEIVSGARGEAPPGAVPRGVRVDVIVGEPQPSGDEESAPAPGVQVERRGDVRHRLRSAAV